MELIKSNDQDIKPMLIKLLNEIVLRDKIKDRWVKLIDTFTADKLDAATVIDLINSYKEDDKNLYSIEIKSIEIKRVQ